MLTAGVAFSGGTSTDPPVPHGFPGVVPAFMGRTSSDRGSAGSPAGGEDRGAAIRRGRRWLGRSRPLGPEAPRWARRTYRRSLLVLRALVDPQTGAALAGPRPGWAYVWPRDAGAIASALASAGYRAEARRIARFLLGLDLDAAARFDRDGEPVEGRAVQGDAAGWVVAAARASGLRLGQADRGGLTALTSPDTWRERGDYQEKGGGDYLGNAIAWAFAAERIGQGSGGWERRIGLEPGGHERQFAMEFETKEGLVRSADDSSSGLDVAAAWAVRPFTQPALIPTARRSLLRLVAERESDFGLVPSEDWDGGDDPWTAPTAWTAWALAALANECRKRDCRAAARRDRRAALGLMADLRRATTPRGLLPERVDAKTGQPTSTTPLAWSHAFAVLAIRATWPSQRPSR
jgi:glucoamylase